ncbi:hypothetical protein DY218_17580 [Streptomyces triticagri]|uniref:Uncharacterized protein n=1 Tax=Streptomyces triticagri TaxID=2293568 RepID=A0A372M3A6_9ACTN|nr:hypothetical protein [Streptomyces triticagri]RFU85404.1 hypothetical protein DY218_17580 [Streptomyces triticagri]
MGHHHKSNQAVEGDPETGHGRGMPRRPDERELERRTEEDRREAGLVAAADEADPWGSGGSSPYSGGPYER